MSPTTTYNPHNTVVVGDRNNRQYQDMIGQPLRKGDFIAHATAASSSVSMHIYRIRDIVDTDTPVYTGSRKIDEGVFERITSWDKAFKLKVVEYNRDYKGRLTPAQEWAKLPPPKFGEYVEVEFEDAKTRIISAVDRVVRLELDV